MVLVMEWQLMIVRSSVVYVDPLADLQAAITAQGAAGGGIVQLGPGTYTITTGLTIPAGSNVSIRGQGVSTIISWVGTDPSTHILRIIQGVELVFEDFYIVANTAAASGIYLEQPSPVVGTPGRTCRFNNITVDGVIGNIGIGIKIGGATDLHNDFHVFDNCGFNNYSNAGATIENSNSFNIRFLNSMFRGNQYGNYGIYGLTGSFSASKCWFTGNKLADTYIGFTAAPVAIEDCNSENSACFLFTSSSTAHSHIHVSRCRWSSLSYLGGNNYTIDLNNVGTVRIDQCIIEQNNPASRSAVIHWETPLNAYDYHANLTVDSCVIYSLAANVFVGAAALNAMVLNSFQHTGQTAAITNLMRLPDTMPRGVDMANTSVGYVSYEDDYVMLDDAVVTY
jgi:hypothetical protein